MKIIYSFDNYEGDKGVIIADSYEEAVEIFKQNYPYRQIAENYSEYCDGGCYLEEVDYVDDGCLYVTSIW